MFVPGAMEHYFHVGRSAIKVIANAMIVSGMTSFKSVLDLPCGGGRVTRHLPAFFPDAKLFVAELDKRKEAFVVKVFAATPTNVTPDFSSEPERRFDLILVGSLLTHLNAAAFERAIEWLIKAVADNGLLLFTTHGRRHDFVERTMHRTIEPERWAAVARDCAQSGFGYVETETKGSSTYGISWSAPSWVMRLLENDSRVPSAVHRPPAVGMTNEPCEACITGANAMDNAHTSALRRRSHMVGFLDNEEI